MASRLIRAILALWLCLTTIGVAAAQGGATPASLIQGAKTRMMSDPADAILLAREALAALPDTGGGAPDAELRATGEWLIGEAYGRLGEPQRALEPLGRARGWAERRRPASMLLGNILLSEGAALTDVGRVADSLITLQRAHDLFVRLKQPRERAKALILIALLYNAAYDHAAALRYFAQAGDAYSGDPGIDVAVDNGRGMTLLALDRFAEAEAEFRKSLAAARRLRSASMIAQSLGNMAEAQLSGGEVGEASRSVAQAITITRRADAAAIRPQLTPLAASIALRQGDVARAQTLIRARFAGVDLGRTIQSDRYAHDAAYRIFLAAGDPAAALRHLVAVKRLDEQATAIARSTSAALAAARFDYANQELRIARLKAADLGRTVAFERATARTERLVFIGVVGTTLLVIALLAFGLRTLRRSRNRERAANEDLAASNTQLAKLSRAKTEFLATTSHEIRTPLNGILGMTQVMLAEDGQDPAMRDRLGVVHAAGLTMRTLVDDILDMAKIETGRMTIEHAPFDLHAVVDQAARLWREPATAKGLAFDVAIGSSPHWIVGDAARLRQVVFNLLSNAVKFTAAGSVSLTLAEEGGRLRIAVADSGIGIDRDAQRFIFDSFRQADAGTTRRFGGTGLGLSISRSLAQAMGGDVTVISRVGAGSCFTLDLPYVAAARPMNAVAPGGLLIVERNPINRAMFRSLFGGRAVTFADASDAVATIARGRPARVLVDAATLGAGGGADDDLLAAIVAAAEPAKVVLLTPPLSDPRRTAAYAAGVTQVIEKPVSKKVLVAAIEALPHASIRDAA